MAVRVHYYGENILGQEETRVYEIKASEELAPGLKLFQVEAPQVARKAQPGQFVVIRVDEKGERIPLTIADQDVEGGTISIIVQAVGKTTMKLSTLQTGDKLANLAGPLGLPSEMGKFGTVVCMGGGFGVAPVYQIARGLKALGNRIITITGARNVSLLFWEDRLRAVSDELYITTDDGSKGMKGFVTDQLKELLEKGLKVDLVFAVGPVPMMRAVAKLTEPYGIRTIASLNPIMVDGTGLCGACRVSVDGKTKFACVDGPDFDAHKVDWDLLMTRLSVYKAQEKLALEKYQAEITAEEEQAKVAATSSREVKAHAS